MRGETLVTLVGNLTADPTLRWTQSGSAVADFTVASTPRTYDRNAGEWRDGDTLFMRCSVWRDVAENVAEVGPSLRRARAQVIRHPAADGGAGYPPPPPPASTQPAQTTQQATQAPQAPQQPAPRQPPTQEDPWARQASQPAANYAAWEPPF